MPDPRRLPYPIMMRSCDTGPRRILGSFTPFGSSDWVFRRLRLDVKSIVFFCMRRGHLGGYQSCSSPQCEAAVGESGIITIDRRYGLLMDRQNASPRKFTDLPNTALIPSRT